ATSGSIAEVSRLGMGTVGPEAGAESAPLHPASPASKRLVKYFIAVALGHG
ncbi:MAG: hypothetical protein ACI80K_003091, partial [Paracoccaceae bacterium]